MHRIANCVRFHPSGCDDDVVRFRRVVRVVVRFRRHNRARARFHSHPRAREMPPKKKPASSSGSSGGGKKPPSTKKRPAAEPTTKTTTSTKTTKTGGTTTTTPGGTTSVRGYWSENEETALKRAVRKHGIGAWEKMRNDPEFVTLRCVRAHAATPI